ncbi:MAG: glycosyltransferase [Methylotenera sp.]|nr:glycosyltransferase [Methylotenera sp.]
MKIVHVSESISSLAGGLQYSVVNLCKAFGRLDNVEAHIVSGKDSGKINFGNEVKATFLEKSNVGANAFLKGLNTMLLNLKPDLIIQHGVWSPFVVQVENFAINNHIPYVVVPHGMLDPYILSRNNFKKKLALFLYQKSNLRNALFVRALNFVEKQHIELLGEYRVVVAPNGILKNTYVDLNHKNENSILFLGRIDHKKGVKELVSAWKKLVKEDNIAVDSKLIIAGWGTDAKYLDEVSEMIKMVPTIKMVGPAFDDLKIDLYSTCGGFILPSKGEGLPTTVLEAWNFGAVVMMSNECNFEKNVFQNKAIYCGNTEAEIITSLRRYFAIDAVTKLNMRNCGFTYLTEFDWDVIAKNLICEVNSGMSC